MITKSDCLDIDLKCKATGGMTITSQDNLQNIDFGTQYSFRNITKEIFVENKSSRP
jgi:hypothetical protein